MAITGFFTKGLRHCGCRPGDFILPGTTLNIPLSCRGGKRGRGGRKGKGKKKRGGRRLDLACTVLRMNDLNMMGPRA